MSENTEQPVERVYVTNRNYEKYYNKLAKEAEEKRLARKLARQEATRLKAPGEPLRHLLQTEIEEMQKVEPGITKYVFSVLGVDKSVRSRTSYGGTAPANVKSQAKAWLKKLDRLKSPFMIR